MQKLIKSMAAAVWWGIAMPIMLISFAVFLLRSGAEQRNDSFVKNEDSRPESAFDSNCSLVLRCSDGSEITTDLGSYLTGVLLAEVPSSFELEALKAQAVAARTFALKTIRLSGKHGAGVICGDAACCQAYTAEEAFLALGGAPEAIMKMQEAVYQTDGIVVMFEGELIEASYFSCSGGSTEEASAVWGAEFPYLTARESRGEENAAVFSEERIYSRDDIETALEQQLPEAPQDWFLDFQYTPGSGVDTVRIGDTVWKGTQIRNRLGLRSTIFSVEVVADSVRITTYGYGHRVGMSQYGAEAMAVSGKDYSEILAYYYPGTEQIALNEKKCILPFGGKPCIFTIETMNGGCNMQFSIDGKFMEPKTGQSLLDLIRENHMDDSSLARRPLAARIAGEVFTLNYVPVRQRDSEFGGSMRRAMAASNGEIRLLRYADSAGREAYIRSALYVVFLALQETFPECLGKVSCTLGNSVYISLENADAFSLDLLREKIQQLIDLDFPMIRRRVPMQEAIAHFEKMGQADKARLLSWRSTDTFDAYFYNEFVDYFYGEMVPSSGYLTVWDVLSAKDGFIVLYPDGENPDKTADFSAMPHFFEVFAEGERWCQLMECETVADLNELTSTGNIRELIRVNEALHEKRFSQIADMVCSRGAKLVMLAGPSSSGKTTSANRLATQLRVHGKKPILMSLDDYYLDRDKIAPGPDGKIDLEHINTIDTELFRQNMADLLRGESVELPGFDFLTGTRVWSGKTLSLHSDSVIIVEGLHGLNPVMLPENLDENLVFRLYVSPLLPLNLDNHNRIPTSYLRLLRRIVRDYKTRGSSVQRTISMWDSVQNGERLWIFPFQENANVIFNSSTLYELAVLKKHIYPLLTAVEPEDACYDEVQSIVKILSFVCEADVDDEIPPTSLVREFVGGNTFYR